MSGSLKHSSCFCLRIQLVLIKDEMKRKKYSLMKNLCLCLFKDFNSPVLLINLLLKNLYSFFGKAHQT